MVEKKPKSSVQVEQFGDDDNNADINSNDEITSEELEMKMADEKAANLADSEVENVVVDEIEIPSEPEKPAKKSSKPKKSTKAGKSETDETEVKEPPQEDVAENITNTPEDIEVSSDSSSETKTVEKNEVDLLEDSAADEVVTDEGEKADKQAEEETTAVKQGTPEKPEKVDYAALSREDLLAILKEILDKGSLLEIIHDVDAIKIQFYKKHKADTEKKRKKFYEEGGAPEDFMVDEDPLEKTLKEYLLRFREYKTEYNKLQEAEKLKNLEEKYKIIEEIKVLVNRKESINKTFHEFRELQRRWREIGPVPQSNLKDLWETYYHHVETFYDYIKINQELRDLDLKKNLEAKISLCEKAEELLLEPNVLSAFNNLQALHDQWREIGPVTLEMRTDIWQRFKEATSKINKRHQDYFLNIKQEQRKNLEAKTLLCEKVEEIVNGEIVSFPDWDKYSHEIIELQKVWRTIGFAPKKDNTRIYKRFREACDGFFNRKREYFSSAKLEQNDNLQLKTDLCLQAEALIESSEWKKTTEDLIALQKRWKEIGPAPQKFSDKIWKRFRSACDKFFERKALHFASMDNSYESNLKKKEELIEKINLFQPTANVEENLRKLKEFQRDWASIGFVPFESKELIQNKYRQAINQKFDDLKIGDDKKDLLKFKNKLDSIHTRPNYDYRMNQERDKFIIRLKQLESDIVLWENNIGFFAKSKNAESMINEVQRKIDDAKSKMEVLTEKIKMIDDLDSN